MSKQGGQVRGRKKTFSGESMTFLLVLLCKGDVVRHLRVGDGVNTAALNSTKYLM